MEFLKIHVLTEDDLSMLIEEGSCTSINDIDCSQCDFNWDYHQIALVDITCDRNNRIMWNDNIHTNIEENIENFLDGIRHTGLTPIVTEIVMMEDDLRNNFTGTLY